VENWKKNSHELRARLKWQRVEVFERGREPQPTKKCVCRTEIISHKGKGRLEGQRVEVWERGGEAQPTEKEERDRVQRDQRMWRKALSHSSPPSRGQASLSGLDGRVTHANSATKLEKLLGTVLLCLSRCGQLTQCALQAGNRHTQVQRE